MRGVSHDDCSKPEDGFGDGNAEVVANRNLGVSFICASPSLWTGDWWDETRTRRILVSDCKIEVDTNNALNNSQQMNTVPIQVLSQNTRIKDLTKLSAILVRRMIAYGELNTYSCICEKSQISSPYCTQFYTHDIPRINLPGRNNNRLITR